MATGEVQLVGTEIGNGSYFPGFELANLFDEDLETSFASSTQNGGWGGVDAGTPVKVTSYSFAPRRGDALGAYEARAVGGKLQGATDSGFSSPVDLDTVPDFPFSPPLQYNERTIDTGVSSYRYYRFLGADGTYCNIAELFFIANAGSITDARPVAPLISPWGGRYPSGSVNVTLTTRTTSASIYYTTDGSTPDNTDTLYTGPIPLNCTSPVTLKAVAYDASLDTPLSEVAVSVFTDDAYVPRADWADNQGNLIEAHSGGILIAEGRYWWYGGNTLYGVSLDSLGRTGITLYVSDDLYNWEVVGNILPLPPGWLAVVRPHVIYNATSGKYVLWAHAYNTPPGEADRAAVATSDNPEGPWTWVNTSLNPDGQGFKDCTLYKTEDGTKAYAIYTAGDQLSMIISELDNDDYLTTTGNFIEVLGDTGSESPAMFERGGKFFLVFSGGSNYYNSNESFFPKYITASTPLGTWSAAADLYEEDPVGSNFNGQISFVVKVPGKIDGYVLGSDYWIAADLYESRQVWLPLTFASSTTVEAQTPATWNLSYFQNEPTPPSAGPASIGNTATLLLLNIL